MSRNRARRRNLGASSDQGGTVKRQTAAHAPRSDKELGANAGRTSLEPRPRMEPFKQSPNRIVGAGIAGLTAALTLQDEDCPARSLKSSGRIGGRMHSDRTYWQHGQTSVWCGEFIDSDHVTIRPLGGALWAHLSDVVAAEPAHSQTHQLLFSAVTIPMPN